MTKKQAIKKFVIEDLQAVPREWIIKLLAQEHRYEPVGMWGTCFIINNIDTDYLRTRMMFSSIQELTKNLDLFGDEEHEKLECAIENEDWNILENYINEEMAGSQNILDQKQRPTSMFLHNMADEYVISINTAGFDFYEGVWDILYDTIGLKWHDEE